MDDKKGILPNQLPTAFQFFGQTITVEETEDLTHFEDSNDVVRYRENKIYIQGKHLTIDQKWNALLHGLNHLIFEKLGYDDVNANDIFVNLHSLLIHEMLITMVFNGKPMGKTPPMGHE